GQSSGGVVDNVKRSVISSNLGTIGELDHRARRAHQSRAVREFDDVKLLTDREVIGWDERNLESRSAKIDHTAGPGHAELVEVCGIRDSHGESGARIGKRQGSGDSQRRTG